jgi:hypothetical protein
MKTTYIYDFWPGLTTIIYQIVFLMRNTLGTKNTVTTETQQSSVPFPQYQR